MRPELFHIGPIPIRSFGLMMALAFIAAYFVLRGEIKRNRLEKSFADTILIAALLGGLAGARIFHIVENFKQFLASPLSFVFTGAGFAWYGGLGGGVLAAGGVVLKKKQPLSVVADCVAPGLALGYGIGRIGCFLSGDGCYGKPTSGWWGMAFPYGIVPTKYAVDELTGKRIPIEWVHPTPLYELTVSLLIFALLWKLRKKELKSGTIFWLYLALAGCARFLVEFWRRNPIVAIGLTMAQLLSILAIGLGIFFVFLNLWQEGKVARRQESR